jgi:hypothetical protein
MRKNAEQTMVVKISKRREEEKAHVHVGVSVWCYCSVDPQRHLS